jgi:hypothetical protein
VIHEQLPPEPGARWNPRRALFIGIVHSWDEIAQMMLLYNVAMCCIDMNPERASVRDLRASFPGRVVGVEFATSYFSDPLSLKPDAVGVPLTVTANRTDMLDGMMDAIRQGRSRPTQVVPKTWVKQMMSLHRKHELDTKGRPYRHYEGTGTAGFDFAMAEGYGMVATILWRMMATVEGHMATSMAGEAVGDNEIGFRRIKLGMSSADRYTGGKGV